MQPAALRPLSRAGSTAAGSLASTALLALPSRAPDPALPLSSRGHQPWLVWCPRSLGTAGAGSRKFTVDLDDVAQTQQWFVLHLYY